MIAAISWRNIWRNKWRSAVIILAITAGLTGGIFTVAMHNGMTEQKLRTAVDIQTAHLQVHARGFPKNKDIRLHMGNAGKIMAALENESAVKAVAGRLVTTGMAASSNANTGVQLNGIIPESENADLLYTLEDCHQHCIKDTERQSEKNDDQHQIVHLPGSIADIG